MKKENSKLRNKKKCVNGNTAVMMINKKCVMTQIEIDDDPSIKEESDVVRRLEKLEEQISKIKDTVNEMACRNNLMQEPRQ